MPCSGPLYLFALISCSAFAASSSARFLVTVIKQFTFGSRDSIRSRYAFVKSTGESFPDLICGASWSRVCVQRVSLVPMLFIRVKDKRRFERDRQLEVANLLQIADGGFQH